MKETQRKLLIAFFAPVIMAVAIIVLYETECLMPGNLPDPTVNFLAGTVMVLLTMGSIPFALYMFRIPKIHKQLTEDAQKAPQRLLLFGLLRIMMLAAPMVVNIWFYYFFSFTTSYFYMAVILFLSMFFIYPSMDRCIAEAPSNLPLEGEASEHGNE